jgi:Kef-type K+ transport system membrane component KefB
LLFVYAGAKLELTHVIELAPVVLAFIVVRFLLTTLLTASAAQINGMSLRKGALLGLALTPLSGFKIVLVQHAAGYYPQFGTQLSALIVSILVILELVGPICTRFALVWSGEARRQQEKQQGKA